MTITKLCQDSKKLMEFIKQTGGVDRARFMGAFSNKRHRKHIVLTDILNNYLIHYNIDSKQPKFIQGTCIILLKQYL